MSQGVGYFSYLCIIILKSKVMQKSDFQTRIEFPYLGQPLEVVMVHDVIMAVCVATRDAYDIAASYRRQWGDDNVRVVSGIIREGGVYVR